MVLPFDTEISYKTRLARLKMLPLCYWHEYLDIPFLFKAGRGLIVTDADTLPKPVDKANLVINLRKNEQFSHYIRHT